MFWVILIIILIVLFLIVRKIKTLKFDCITLVVGGVKCGKTTLQVHLAIKEHKKRVLKWKIKNYWIDFTNLFRKKYNRVDHSEKPLLYSNIPLKYDYVELTEDLLLRQKRFNYKSVILLSETSLVADSMSYKNEDVSEQLTMFYKLIGHETLGGSVFTETQNPSDNHYALRRTISRFLYIHHLTKWVPFILIYKVREFAYLDGVDGINNNFETDAEDTMKTLIVPKRIWKKFDAYTYSALTDNLDTVDNVIYKEQVYTLKSNKILSLKNILKKKGVK